MYKFNVSTANIILLKNFVAGFVACTTTNPIWFVKTRIQLDGQSVTAAQCIKRIYKQSVSVYLNISRNECFHFSKAYRFRFFLFFREF